MSPIKDISDIRRIPRLGKIHLGVKIGEGRGSYPQATDYFVVPATIMQYVGDKPKSLKIMFPSDNPDDFAPQWLKCYSFSQKLVCKGDGFLCRRKVDTLTGDFASHTTEEWIFQEGLLCEPDDCPKYQEKQCRRVMNLQFFMHEVPGLGLWQLDTTSIYSIININSSLDLIKKLCGRLRMIPLVLSLEPQEVEPLGQKKKLVHILHLRSDIKLVDIQRLLRKKPEEVLLPELDEEEIPSDLYLTEGATPQAEEAGEAPGPGAEVGKERPAAGKPGKTPAPPVAKSRNPGTIKPEDVPDANSLARVCYECWGMQPTDIARELGGGFLRDIASTARRCWECFLQIRAGREGPPEQL
jgi:hypothetical protein